MKPEWHNPENPRLRELVFVHVYAVDGDFDLLLTRVPGIGEEINQEDRSYKVVRVQHEPVENDGRARLGWHAFVDAELLPSEDAEPSAAQRRVRKRTRSRGAKDCGNRAPTDTLPAGTKVLGTPEKEFVMPQKPPRGTQPVISGPAGGLDVHSLVKQVLRDAFWRKMAEIQESEGPLGSATAPTRKKRKTATVRSKARTKRAP
jgi:hypothetical protein